MTLAGPDPALDHHPENIGDLGRTRRGLGTKDDAAEDPGIALQAEKEAKAQTDENSFNSSPGA